MKIVLAYCSPNTTTKRLSGLLSDNLTALGHTVTLLNMAEANAAESPALWEADVIGIGAPVYQLRLASPARRFLSAALPHLRPQASSFLYITYSGICSGRALENAMKLLTTHHIGISGALKVTAPHSYGSEPYPDEAVKHLAADFCAKLNARNFMPYPHTQAKRSLKCRSFKARLVYPLTEFVGKLRELPIRINTDACTGCGRCARECPANAILIEEKAVRNAAACIHCYRCAVVCPKKAVICPIEKLEDMVRFNKKLLGLEQPQNEIVL